MSGTLNNTGHSVVFILDGDSPVSNVQTSSSGNSGSPVNLMRGFKTFKEASSRVKRNEEEVLQGPRHEFQRHQGSEIYKRSTRPEDLRSYKQTYPRQQSSLDVDRIYHPGQRKTATHSSPSFHFNYYNSHKRNSSGAPSQPRLGTNRLIEASVRSDDRFSHKEGVMRDEGRMYASLTESIGAGSDKPPVINITGGPLSYRYQVRGNGYFAA